MSEKKLRLPPRLVAIAGFIEKGSNVADIGTDHGFLPVYLAQKGFAQRIIASDKSSDSLKSALRSAVKYGVADKISFIAAPGLSGVDEAEVDTVVIAGMGGETIMGILADAPWTKRCGTRLILQPQTKTDKLCYWLNENGYSIRDLTLTQDKGRYYIVLRVQSH